MKASEIYEARITQTFCSYLYHEQACILARSHNKVTKQSLLHSPSLCVCMTACKSTGQVAIKAFAKFLEALRIQSQVSSVGTATKLRVG
jgi:hypothetical protein